MKMHCRQPYSLNPKIASRYFSRIQAITRSRYGKSICLMKPRIYSPRKVNKRGAVQEIYVVKAIKDEKDDDVDADAVVLAEKKGTIGGAVALIIGTSIGSGILALPNKAYPAGLVPSSISMIICWAFLLIEALILVEINVGLMRKRGNAFREDGFEIVSIRTMAQETLGEWGGALASVTYIFMSYTSMVAYCSKSGEILSHLIDVPESLSSCFFTAIFAVLIAVGGAKATDQVNQWLTASMIGLLVAIEVVGVVFGGWSGFGGGSDNWGKVPATIPVIIFSLVYHDLAPGKNVLKHIATIPMATKMFAGVNNFAAVLCAYLGGDLARIRSSVLLGSLVPLLSLLVWDAIVLGLSAQTDYVGDPIELLMSVRWSGVSIMVEAFSLLAIGTSIIGTLLGFSEFFKEQLNGLSSYSTTRETLQAQDTRFDLQSWWGSNKIKFTAAALVVAPTFVVSATIPDAFSAATDIAGGYCMTILYGVLPPAMAWGMLNRENKDSDQNTGVSKAKPALVWIGLFACGIVMEQIYQDFPIFHVN